MEVEEATPLENVEADIQIAVIYLSQKRLDEAKNQFRNAADQAQEAIQPENSRKVRRQARNLARKCRSFSDQIGLQEDSLDVHEHLQKIEEHIDINFSPGNTVDLREEPGQKVGVEFVVQAFSQAVSYLMDVDIELAREELEQAHAECELRRSRADSEEELRYYTHLEKQVGKALDAVQPSEDAFAHTRGRMVERIWENTEQPPWRRDELIVDGVPTGQEVLIAALQDQVEFLEHELKRSEQTIQELYQENTEVD